MDSIELHVGNYGSGSLGRFIYLIDGEKPRWQKNSPLREKKRLEAAEGQNLARPKLDMNAVREIAKIFAEFEARFANKPPFTRPSLRIVRNVGTEIFRGFQHTDAGLELIGAFHDLFKAAGKKVDLPNSLFSQFDILTGLEEATLAGEGNLHSFSVGENPEICWDSGSGSKNAAVLERNKVVLTATGRIGPHFLPDSEFNIARVVREELAGYAQIGERAGKNPGFKWGGGNERAICRLWHIYANSLHLRVHGTKIESEDFPAYSRFLGYIRTGPSSRIEEMIRAGGLDEATTNSLLRRVRTIPKVALVDEMMLEHFGPRSVTYTRTGVPEGLLRRVLAERLPQTELDESSIVYASRYSTYYGIGESDIAAPVSAALGRWLSRMLQKTGIRPEVLEALCNLTGPKAESPRSPRQAYNGIMDAKHGDASHAEAAFLAVALYVYNGGSAEDEYLNVARSLLKGDHLKLAKLAGLVLRMAYQIAPNPERLAEINDFARLVVERDKQEIHLEQRDGVTLNNPEIVDATRAQIASVLFPAGGIRAMTPEVGARKTVLDRRPSLEAERLEIAK